VFCLWEIKIAIIGPKKWSIGKPESFFFDCNIIFILGGDSTLQGGPVEWVGFCTLIT
jgi:hypothetical protein